MKIIKIFAKSNKMSKFYQEKFKVWHLKKFKISAKNKIILLKWFFIIFFLLLIIYLFKKIIYFKDNV